MEDLALANRIDLPSDDIVARYRRGESENAIATRYSVSRTVIRRHLTEAGVAIRGQSDAERVKWSRMTPDQRRAQVAAAHESTKGSGRSWHTLVSKARRVMRSPSGVSEYETDLRQLIERRGGLDPIPQFAVGPYNCDLAVFPVAVEVWGGGWHFSGHHARRDPKRVRYLMDHGWHVMIVVAAPKRGHAITDRGADEVVAFVEFARRDPTTPREYRMIGGDGEALTSGGEDDAQVTLEWPFSNRRDPTTGRYERVARDA